MFELNSKSDSSEYYQPRKVIETSEFDMYSDSKESNDPSYGDRELLITVEDTRGYTMAEQTGAEKGTATEELASSDLAKDPDAALEPKTELSEPSEEVQGESVPIKESGVDERGGETYRAAGTLAMQGEQSEDAEPKETTEVGQRELPVESSFDEGEPKEPKSDGTDPPNDDPPGDLPPAAGEPDEPEENPEDEPERRWAPGELRDAVKDVVAALEEQGIDAASLLPSRLRDALPHLVGDNSNAGIAKDLGYNDKSAASELRARVLDALVENAPPEALPDIPQPTGAPKERSTGVGAEINELRRIASVKIKDIEKDTGISFSTLERIFSGAVHSSPTKISAILDAIGIGGEYKVEIIARYKEETRATRGWSPRSPEPPQPKAEQDQPTNRIGTEIDALRKAANLSFKGLAEQIGESPEVVRRALKGEHHPPITKIRAILAALGVSGDLEVRLLDAYRAEREYKQNQAQRNRREQKGDSLTVE